MEEDKLSKTGGGGAISYPPFVHAIRKKTNINGSQLAKMKKYIPNMSLP